jgi:hypothetical protein
MRVAAAYLSIALAGGCWPACAQMDEKPPVLKRGDNSIPSSQPGQTPTGQKPTGKSGKDSGKTDPDTFTANGIIRHIDDKSITVEADDTRILTCALTAATKLSGPEGKLTADDLDPGMHVTLQVRSSANQEEFTAISIVLVIPPGNANAADAKSKTPEEPPDEEGRPILRRGIPAKRKSSDDDDDTVASAKPAASAKPPAEGKAEPVTSADTVESDAPAKPATGEAAQSALIEKAREVTAEFSSKLPNFVCQQFTTRYQRESKATGWEAQDVVSATVVYSNGVEEYQNIKIGNKAGPKSMMDTKGQTSTGDFNSTLESLMETGRAAEFHYVKDAELKRLRTRVYTFAVAHATSDWEISTGGQKVFPAYSGRIWIDRDSGRVLRIERQADKLPESFPMDTVEQTVDYDFVRLGDRKVLLPAESENLSCQRGSSFCAKNVIEFRNYKEFRGEATIDFEK